LAGREDTIARQTLIQDVELFRQGCNLCWSALFLKAMSSLGQCGPVEEMRQLDNSQITGLRVNEGEVVQSYMTKYETFYWDVHCTEPRGRSGRHTAFIKHNCWFHCDNNPALKLNAFDGQVQALTRFRLGTHRLRCNEHTLPMHQRLCILCGCRRIEDEMHIILECEAYAQLRAKPKWANLFRADNQQDLKCFMTQADQYTLSAFICNVLRMRQNMLTERDVHADLVDPELP